MDIFLRFLPFFAAESLLVWSLWRLRRFVFVASFLVLFLASVFAVASEGSSAVFSFIGFCVIVFGLTCMLLGNRIPPGSFVSRSNLRAIGALFFVLGFGCLFIV